VPELDPRDALPGRPRRCLVGGASGSGKTTLARHLADRLGLPHTELDALFHGPGWTPRPEFENDVRALAASPNWVTEYQYDRARPILLARCDLVVYLALPRRLVMSRLIRRTVLSRRGTVLWNGNREPPLRSFFTDRDHVVRWAWRSHGHDQERIDAIRATRPDVPLVVLRSPDEVVGWLAGVTRGSAPE
jgi:adenylate kinase family enzyme